MKILDRAFPHPVLSPFRDDVLPNAFSADLNVTTDLMHYILNYSFSCDNPTILSLISQSKAYWGIHVECRNNFFRQLFRQNGPTGSIQIPADELVGTVEAAFFVAAAEDHPSYQIAGAHPDYGKTQFNLNAGEILAFCDSVTFEADKQYDPLKQISSILQICPDAQQPSGIAKLATGEQKLTVFLSEADHQKYADLQGSKDVTATILQSMVIPILIEAIWEMRDTDPASVENGEVRRWFKIIEQRLSGQGINFRAKSHTPFELAQKLVGNPTGPFLNELLKLTER